MVNILQKNDPILREKAKTVPEELFGTTKLKKILKDMKMALSAQDDGVAIAAPQIGVSLRIFVVSGKVFEMLKAEGDSVTKQKDLICINPEIIKISKEKHEVEEGCLSVRYLYGTIERSKKAKIRARDENGDIFELGGSGLLAQIFQHETDHLQGKLFIDNAKDIKDLPPGKNNGHRAIDQV